MSYVATGQPWLPLAPGHWEVVKLKRLLREVSTKGFPDEPLLAATQAHGVVLKSDYAVNTVTATKDLHLLKLVEPGDFVISLRSFQGGIEYSHARGIISPAYTVLRANSEHLQEYLAVVFKSLPFIGLLKAHVTGIRQGQNVDWQQLREAALPLPPEDDMRRVVQGIGGVTAAASNFVQKKRDLIKLLEEQRRQILQRAVLPEDEPQAPTGLPWSPSAPSSWARTKLKYVATIQTGLTLGKDYGNQEVAEYPYMRVANVQTDHVDLRTVRSVSVPPGEAERCSLRKGDVLVTEGGDLDKLGRGALWSGEIQNCLHQNHVFVVRCGPELEPDFLIALLASQHGRTYFELTAKKTTNLASTNSTTLRSFPMALPKPEQQRLILKQLAQDSQQIDAALRRAYEQIQLAGEYRNRLVSDLISGCRDAAELDGLREKYGARGELDVEALEDDLEELEDLVP